MALAASGCGGDSSGSDAESQVRAAVQEVLTTKDASRACSELTTRHFLQIAYGGSERTCESQVQPATSVKITTVDVSDDRATAAVKATSPERRRPVAIQLALVKEGDEWKLDDFSTSA